jgi:hypothetical protein
MLKKNFNYFIILLGFLISTLYSFYIIKNYDRNFINSKKIVSNYIIQGDTEVYFNEAELLNEQKKIGINFFERGSDYYVSFLYPRIISNYYSIINKDIKFKNNIDEEGYFQVKNGKFFLLIFQSLIYYLSIFFLYRVLISKLDKRIITFLILFLCFEPNILQFHSHFLTESIYFSFLILLISLIINLKKNKSYYFFIGILVGLMYLQRSVAFYLIFPIAIFYFYYVKEKYFYFKILLFIIIGQIFILSFVGFSNYKRSGIFYIVAGQTKHAMWYYLTDQIFTKIKTENNKILYDRLNDERKWIEENNINTEKEEDRLLLRNYYQNYFFDKLLKYPLASIKIILWKSAQSSILDPLMVISSLGQDFSIDKYWEKNLLKMSQRIVYSIIIYFISIIGFYSFYKNKNYLIPSIFFILGVYHISLLGWVGVSRYSAPSILCISVFFSNGLVYLHQRFKFLKNIKFFFYK